MAKKATSKKAARKPKAAARALPKHVIRSMPLSQLQAAPHNPREISDRALEGLGRSIERFGLVQPIVWNKKTGNVVGGHQRIKALEARGESRASVLIVDMPIKEERALNVALNSQAISGEWTDDLAALLDQIKGDTPDLYGELLLDDLRSETKASVVEDEAPEAQAEAISRTGDLWLLGDGDRVHRVLCGDSTVAGDVERVMGGEKADAVLTDPPYGVGIDYGSFDDSPENVSRLIEGVMPLILNAPCAALTPGVPAMWSYPKPSWVGAWVHPAPCGGCPWGFVGNNPILYYGDDPYLKAGLGRRPDSVVMASDREGVEGHPTPKPMKVWAWLLERVTVAQGTLVLDPFLGSGTTLIAAEQLGRKCFGIEIEPKYCDVIVRRWEKLTGREARLDQNVSGRAGPGQAEAGVTFAEIQTERTSDGQGRRKRRSGR